MLKKTIMPLVVLAVVAGAVGLGVFLNKSEPQANGTVLGADVSIEDHQKGNPQAKVVVIEYADYQCPACAAYSPITDRLMAENADWINFAYRNFPLRSIHKNTDEAAYAAEAAGLQGKFWEMKTMLYERQSAWSAASNPEQIFAGYASELGLNAEQFNRDSQSSQVKNKVETDLKSAESLGLNSTPTFIVNGKKISNPSNYDQFLELLKQANQQ